jgi:hypothetical protein
MKEHMICERAVDNKSFGAYFLWAGLKMTEVCQLATVDQLLYIARLFWASFHFLIYGSFEHTREKLFV